MKSHNMTSLKFIIVLYQFHCQTLPIMKIDGAKSNFESTVQQERKLWSLKEGKELHIYTSMNSTLGRSLVTARLICPKTFSFNLYFLL